MIGQLLMDLAVGLFIVCLALGVFTTAVGGETHKKAMDILFPWGIGVICLIGVVGIVFEGVGI